MAAANWILSHLLLLCSINWPPVVCGVGSVIHDMQKFLLCEENALFVSEVFCLPRDYRKDVPPPSLLPINVYINLPLSEISVIDDQHSQISIRLYYKLLWPEPRMVLNASADWTQGKQPVGASLIDLFWTPDLIIHDLVEFNKPEMVSEVAALQIKKENSVYYKLRADLTIVCKGMEFGLYPFDKHMCYLKLTSFGHTTEEMILNGGFTYEDSNQRELLFGVKIQEVKGSSDVFVGRTNNYSMYSLEIRLTRFVTPYLLNVYLPTGIFVVMSWVSFIIPAEVIAARITLLITLCLALINTFNNVTERIPVANKETAMEYWISACICLVFAALAEYAFILFKMVRLKRKKRKWHNDRLNDGEEENRLFGTHQHFTDPIDEERRKVRDATTGTAPISVSPPTVAGPPCLSSVLVGTTAEVVVGVAAASMPPPASGTTRRTRRTQPKWRDTLHAAPSAVSASSNSSQADSDTDAPGVSKSPHDRQLQRELTKVQEHFDEQARIIYPSLFAVFNLCYWIYYMSFVLSRI